MGSHEVFYVGRVVTDSAPAWTRRSLSAPPRRDARRKSVVEIASVRHETERLRNFDFRTGFFANGEIGPIGARIPGDKSIPSFLHGFTATAAVLVDTGEVAES